MNDQLCREQLVSLIRIYFVWADEMDVSGYSEECSVTEEEQEDYQNLYQTIFNIGRLIGMNEDEVVHLMDEYDNHEKNNKWIKSIC